MSGNKDLPIRCVSKGSHQQPSAIKGRKKSDPRNLCKRWGFPSLALRTTRGQSGWHEACRHPHHRRESLHMLWHGGVASTADAVGWAMWLSPLLPLPARADPSSTVAHPHRWHRTLPTSMQEAHGDTRHIPYRRMLGHQRVHMDTCPPGQRSRRHGLSVCGTAAAPRLPPAASQEPVPHSTVLGQAAGALPVACGSFGVPAANAEDSHHRQDGP